MTDDVRAPRPLFWVVADSKDELAYALAVASELRALAPDATVESDLAGRGLVKGLSRAAQIQADPGRHAHRTDGVRAVLLGSREREDQNVTIKDLSTGEQQTFPRRELAERLGAARER
jgi:histidyl-tRNA synthetase